MRRRRPILIGALCATGTLALAIPASAQSQPPLRLMASASVATGRVHGVVRDHLGKGLPDASILAVGQTILSARSDTSGRFSLSLPPGDYILRATREGYISNYREPVRIQGSTLVERNITLTRQAGGATPAVDPRPESEMAWRLKHLARSVLRDGSGARVSSANVAPSGFVAPDFRGQLNLVTTTVSGPASVWMPASWPRGVAFVSLGAPVVGHGMWQMRAAVASGDGSSWNVLGEYETDRDPDRSHLWNLRLSYSAQGYTRATDRLAVAVAESRSAAGVAGQDRWRIGSGVEVTYGFRAERFDYLAEPYLLSGHSGVMVQLMPRTFVRGSVVQSMVAPGADEFLPPPAGGTWLPVEHTFMPLSGRRALRAERVRHGEFTIGHQLGSWAGSPTIRVRRFRQRTADQIATLFGVSSLSTKGQYLVAPAGTVDVVGWGVGADSRLTPYVTAQLEYTRVTSVWEDGYRGRDLRRAAPSVVRMGLERLHDLTASVQAEVARTATHVSLVYRASTAFSRHVTSTTPEFGSRFDVQVRQGLPYRPTRGSRLELLFSVRNLFRDVRGESSWYDELLTVGPPLKMMGGVQVRF